MGHNSVVSGYPKSMGIPWVDGLSTRPSGFRASHMFLLSDVSLTKFSYVKTIPPQIP